MTLVVAVPAPDGVALGSDSLGSFEGFEGDSGLFIRDAKKLVMVGRAAVGFSGFVTPGGTFLDDHLDRLTVHASLSVEQVALAATALTTRLLTEESALQGRSLSASLLVAGVDDDGVGRIYRSRPPRDPPTLRANTTDRRLPDWVGDAGFVNDLAANFVLRLDAETLDMAAEVVARLICITDSFQRLAAERLANSVRIRRLVAGPAVVAKLRPDGVTFEEWDCGVARTHSRNRPLA